MDNKEKKTLKTSSSAPASGGTQSSSSFVRRDYDKTKSKTTG